MKKLLSLCIFSVFLIFLAPHTESSQKIEILGKWDYGSSFDAIGYKNYLYVAAGGQVRIYDISTKEKIKNIKLEPINLAGIREWGTYKEKTPPVNILHTQAGTIRGLYAEGKYLYVIGSKFVIADISKPERAKIISTVNVGGRDVEIKGNYAFIGTYGKGIIVVDISDKKNPKVVKKISLGGYNRVSRFKISGNYLYVAMSSDKKLVIIDIKDPENPSIVANWTSKKGRGKDFSSVAIKGSYAYVVHYYDGIHVVDVSNPKSPEEKNYIGAYGASDIKLFENYLFLSTRYEGFRIYDIKDPEKPSLISKCRFSVGYAESIFPYRTSYGTYVFETASAVGWAIIDVSDIKSPKLMTDPMIPVPVGNSVKVKGNYAFIGAWDEAVWVLDVSKPENPKVEVIMINGGRNTGLEISKDGKYLYVASSWCGLSIADISDPKNPKWEIIDYGPDIGGNIVLVDNYLYAEGLRIYDVSNPKKPKMYTKNMGFGWAGRPYARYKKNYLLCGGRKGFFIVDISKRTDPVVVGKLNLDLYAFYGKIIGVSGNIAYVASGQYLYSIDISDVKNPRILNKVYIVHATSLTIYKNYAYVISEYHGFRVVNIGNPSGMKVEEKKHINAPGIDEENGLLYTSKGYVLSIKK